MRHAWRIWVVLGITAWSLLGYAADSPRQNPQLTVFVVERAGASARVLADAERNAARVFHQAGVDVDWINCDQINQESACGRFSQADLVVRLVPRALALSDEIFGVAFVENNAGTYADVFFDSIRRLREQDREVSLSPILGDVLAHEVGHLLLGTNAHSREGIMQAHWQAGQLQSVAKGQMRFTGEQASKMRARVSSMRRNRNDSTVVAMAHQ